MCGNFVDELIACLKSQETVKVRRFSGDRSAQASSTMNNRCLYPCECFKKKRGGFRGIKIWQGQDDIDGQMCTNSCDMRSYCPALAESLNVSTSILRTFPRSPRSPHHDRRGWREAREASSGGGPVLRSAIPETAPPQVAIPRTRTAGPELGEPSQSFRQSSSNRPAHHTRLQIATWPACPLLKVLRVAHADSVYM